MPSQPGTVVYTTKPQIMTYPRIEPSSSSSPTYGRMLFSTPYNALNIIQTIAHFAIDSNTALIGTALGLAIPFIHYRYYNAVPKSTQAEIEQEHFGQVMMIDQKVQEHNSKHANPKNHIGNEVDGFSTYLFAKAILPSIALATASFAPPLCHLVTFIGTSKNAFSFGQSCVKFLAPPKAK